MFNVKKNLVFVRPGNQSKNPLKTVIAYKQKVYENTWPSALSH